ncbi:MAG: hypothetical protein EOO20_26375 [Chryseobacterium sp.]|nr:MAG: hypothetical protein EOO20_26375 [Chryseobacterium sp.]
MKTRLTILLLSVASIAIAQQNYSKLNKQQIDSIKNDAIDQAALLYPRIRQFSITHMQGFEGKINSKFQGKPLFDGRAQLGRTNINMSLPILDTKNNSFLGSLGVVHQFTKISNVINYDPQRNVTETENYIPMLALGAAFVHRDTIFNHAVTFTGSVSGLFNPSFSSKQITFTGLITVPIIQRQYTRLTAGIVVNIDPSSPIPAFLMVSYFHKFKSSDIDLMIDAPYRIALRKSIKSRTSLTLQTEVGGNNSFFDFKSASLPSNLTYSTLELKSGLLFEYRVSKKMIFSLSGGALTTATSKIFEQGEKSSNAFVKNQQGTVPYAQVGISLLPFWRPFKK